MSGFNKKPVDILSQLMKPCSACEHKTRVKMQKLTDKLTSEYNFFNRLLRRTKHNFFYSSYPDTNNYQIKIFVTLLTRNWENMKSSVMNNGVLQR